MLRITFWQWHNRLVPRWAGNASRQGQEYSQQAPVTTAPAAAYSPRSRVDPAAILTDSSHPRLVNNVPLHHFGYSKSLKLKNGSNRSGNKKKKGRTGDQFGWMKIQFDFSPLPISTAPSQYQTITQTSIFWSIIVLLIPASSTWWLFGLWYWIAISLRRDI